MKELIKVNKVYLEEFEVYVEPYMTIQQEQATVNLMMETNDEFVRKIALMNSVIEFCTDIPTDENIDLNDIIVSGLWDEIVCICESPIREIKEIIKKYDSMDYAFSQILDILSDNIENISSMLPSQDKIEEIIKSMVEKQEKK